MSQKFHFLITALILSTSFLNAQEIPAYWTFSSDLLTVKESSEVQHGNYALKVYMNSVWTQYIWTQEFPVNEYENITFSYYYNTSANVKVGVTFIWDEYSETTPGYYGGDGQDDTEYHLFTYQTTVPMGKTSVQIGISFNVPLWYDPGEIQYIDHIMFENPTDNPVSFENQSFEKWGLLRWDEITGRTAEDGSSDDYYGYSVSLSDNYGVVGAYYEDHDKSSANPLNDAGSAYVIRKNTGGFNNWGQVTKLVASDRATEDYFGYASAIYEDYVIIGAYMEDEDRTGSNYKSDAGSAYIFYRHQGGTNTWNQMAKIVPIDREKDDHFGKAVDISEYDYTYYYAIVGAPHHDYNATGGDSLSMAGAAYIFEKDHPDDDKWGQIGKLVPDDRAEGDLFGTSVAISGNTTIVGAPGEDEDASGAYSMNCAGSAYVFNFDQIRKIVPEDRQEYAEFGHAVSVSGSWAIISAPYNKYDTAGNNEMNNAGAAYIFYKNSGGSNNWGQVAKLVADDRSPEAEFGVSVHISGDYAIVGAKGEQEDAINGNAIENAGAAYVFYKHQGGAYNWGQVTKLTASDRGLNNFFGASVALSEEYALAGAWGHNNNQGKCYTFTTVVQADSILLNDIRNDRATISWKNGFDSLRAVFIKYQGIDIPQPPDGNTYLADTVFGSGSQIGATGWYCVYNDTGSTVTVTGLTAESDYRVMVCEYYGSEGTESYYNVPGSLNPADFTTGIDFSNVEVDVSAGKILGTTTNMQYSLNSSDGTDGDWLSCSLPNTNVDFVPGKVWIKQIDLPDNYAFLLEIPEPADAPTFSVNYYREVTNEIIPVTAEYNYDNDFSSTQYIGTDTELELTPGTDVYLRMRATAVTLPSEVQHLVVDDRLAPPAYTIDFINETTAEVGDTLHEYWSYYDSLGIYVFSDTINAPSAKITLEPCNYERKYYFRVRAFDTSFASTWQILTLPERIAAPDYSIDFTSEVTNENIPETDEYSYSGDFTDAMDGQDTRLPLTPGTDVCFRTKATTTVFAGKIQHLAVPERPAIPVVSLSDKNSATAKFKMSADGSGEDVTLADMLEYSIDGGNTWFQISNTTTVDSRGIQNIIVKKKATLSSFTSNPTINLDYEKPAVIASIQSECNGPENEVIVQSTQDNGKVYIILEGEPQSAAEDLTAAVEAKKASCAEVTTAFLNIPVSTAGLIPGTYYAYATNLIDSLSDRGSNPITIYGIPDVTLGDDIIKCDSTEVTLDPGPGYITYEWSINNATTQSVKVTEEDDYFVTVTDDHGCRNSDTISVRYNIPYQQEQICVVTIDLASGKNVIVWEKTTDVGIIAYNIYRESTIGVYNLIGTLPVDELSVFKDTTANPESQSFLYKITTIDSCGNESLLDSSKYHRPSFLQYVSSEGGVNLEWTDYNIQDIENIGAYLTSYVIYRGTDSTGLTEYYEAGSINTYTDTDPDALEQRYYYRVAALLKDPCYPTGTAGKKAESGPYSHSMSNLEDNRLKTGKFESLIQNDNLVIHPNPFSKTTIFTFNNPEKNPYTLYIMDLSGKVYRIVDHLSTSRYVLEKGDLKEGMYFVELRGERIFRGKIIIE
jgi:hypothetical protein